MQPEVKHAWLTKASENIISVDKDGPCSSLSTPDLEDRACFTFSCATPHSIFPSPSSSLIIDNNFAASVAMTSTQSNICSDDVENKHSELTQMVGNEKKLTVYGHSILPPSCATSLCPKMIADSYSSSPISPQLKSVSHRPENTPKTSPFPSLHGGIYDLPPITNNAIEEAYCPISIQLDRDSPSASHSLILETGCLHLPSLCPQSFTPALKDALVHDADDLIDTVTEITKTQEAIDGMSDTGRIADVSEHCRIVCNKLSTDPQVLSCGSEELMTETVVELRNVCVKTINVIERQEREVLHDDQKACSRTEFEPKDSTETDSLDQFFQTCVDSSEDDSEDVETFFQQLNTEGQIYWAEPIQVSNPITVAEESKNLEASETTENSLSSRSPIALDVVASAGKSRHISLLDLTMNINHTLRKGTSTSEKLSLLTEVPFQDTSAVSDAKLSSSRVSVQMLSSSSTHIIERKDVPYMNKSKRMLLPTLIPLDTSTPFRAVQSWTDLHVQRNTMIKKFSHRDLYAIPDKLNIFTSASETSERPTEFFSLSSSFPLLSTDKQSYFCLAQLPRNYRTASLSVDKELWSNEVEHVDSNGNKKKEKLNEGSQTTTMASCRTCDHQCACCSQRRYDRHTCDPPVSNTT